jgi:FkbM family methyltransferase
MYPQASIVGFEPNPFIQKVLYKNCKQIPMLQLYQSAVGGISGQATFYIHTKSTKSSSFEMRDKKAQAVTVSVVTLDDILPGESIDLLKLDVEGAEFSILENGALSRINSIIAEIHEDIANRSVKELQEICERTHEVKLRSIGKGRYMLYARKK